MQVLQQFAISGSGSSASLKPQPLTYVRPHPSTAASQSLTYVRTITAASQPLTYVRTIMTPTNTLSTADTTSSPSAP